MEIVIFVETKYENTVDRVRFEGENIQELFTEIGRYLRNHDTFTVTNVLPRDKKTSDYDWITL